MRLGREWGGVGVGVRLELGSAWGGSAMLRGAGSGAQVGTAGWRGRQAGLGGETAAGIGPQFVVTTEQLNPNAPSPFDSTDTLQPPPASTERRGPCFGLRAQNRDGPLASLTAWVADPPRCRAPAIPDTCDTGHLRYRTPAIPDTCDTRHLRYQTPAIPDTQVTHPTPRLSNSEITKDCRRQPLPVAV